VGLSLLKTGIGEEVRLAHLTGVAHIPHPQGRAGREGQRLAVHRQTDDLPVGGEGQ